MTSKKSDENKALNEEIRREVDSIGFNYDECESNDDIMEVDAKIANFIMNKARLQGKRNVIQKIVEMAEEEKEGSIHVFLSTLAFELKRECNA